MERFQTRLFEISSEAARGGKRPIKLILHRIMDDPSDYQTNGISWKEEYVVEAAKRIAHADIAVEYLRKGDTADETEIGGHGYAKEEVKDADGRLIPKFNKNSEVVGSIERAYVTDVEIDGVMTHVLMADGVIYEHRHRGLVDWLKKNVPLGTVLGSVEIVGTPENNNQIVYEDGYKEYGRVPMQYEYAGYAILSASVPPADEACYILEVNEKEENSMDESKIRELVEEIKGELHAVYDKNTELTNELNSANEQRDAKVNELEEANTKVQTLETALEQVKAELETYREAEQKLWEENEKKWSDLCNQKAILEKEIAEYKVKERLSELEAALEPFTDEQKAVASEQIEAYKADPMNHEVNSIVDTIYVGIGKKAMETKPEPQHVDEQNSKHEVDDIFSEIVSEDKIPEEGSIF